jgi:hypothetical protein
MACSEFALIWENSMWQRELEANRDFFSTFFLDVKKNYKRIYLNRLAFQIHRLIQVAKQSSLNAQGAVAQQLSTAKQSMAPLSGARERESARARERERERKERASERESEEGSERERARGRERAPIEHSETTHAQACYTSSTLKQLMLYLLRHW